LVKGAPVMVAHHTASTPTPIILDRRGLAALGVPFSNAWLIDLERRGLFPKRFKLPESNRTFWLYAEIDEYLKNSAAASRCAAGE
jgi:predicted DNA-binding transcriptional regulator AlpA